MLKHTFCHIPRIGIKTEARLWEAGITSWADLAVPELPKIASSRLSLLKNHAAISARQLDQGNYRFFEERLPAACHWRLFPELKHRTAYLDIETTGLSWPSGVITSIALYDGKEIRTYVQGENLDDFIDDIRAYECLITYNGKCFDIPFIESYFQCRLDQVQIDLRYVLKSLGYGGGLKSCERQLGIDRGEISGIDGYFAVILWYDFVRTGNRKALETLLAYNIQDVVSLETLMVMAFNMKIENTPFETTLEIPMPVPPAIPFHVDAPTVDRLMRIYR